MLPACLSSGYGAQLPARSPAGSPAPRASRKCRSISLSSPSRRPAMLLIVEAREGAGVGGPARAAGRPPPPANGRGASPPGAPANGPGGGAPTGVPLAVRATGRPGLGAAPAGGCPCAAPPPGVLCTAGAAAALAATPSSSSSALLPNMSTRPGMLAATAFMLRLRGTAVPPSPPPASAALAALAAASSRAARARCAAAFARSDSCTRRASGEPAAVRACATRLEAPPGRGPRAVAALARHEGVAAPAPLLHHATDSRATPSGAPQTPPPPPGPRPSRPPLQSHLPPLCLLDELSPQLDKRQQPAVEDKAAQAGSIFLAGHDRRVLAPSHRHASRAWQRLSASVPILELQAR